MTILELLALNAAVVAAGMLAVWAMSLPLKDVSIVDIWWGLGYVAIAAATFEAAAEEGWRPAAMTLIAALWGLRLGGHLFWRWLGHAREDRRYAAMRKAAGPAFWWRSLYSVFALQGALMLLIASPVMAAIAYGGDAPFGVLDALAFALFGFGLVFETVADVQLSRFRDDPAHAGMVFDKGLWAWSRHPNYFGETVAWWGIGLFGVASTGALWLLVAPIVVTYLLLRVSGVPMQEHGAETRRPGYADYIRRTSAFLPLPPGQSR